MQCKVMQESCIHQYDTLSLLDEEYIQTAAPTGRFIAGVFEIIPNIDGTMLERSNLQYT